MHTLKEEKIKKEAANIIIFIIRIISWDCPRQWSIAVFFQEPLYFE